MQRIRTWLEINKVFFETFAAVLLRVMALVVSCQANRIANYQTELMEAEYQPVFDIDRGGGEEKNGRLQKDLAVLEAT